MIRGIFQLRSLPNAAVQCMQAGSEAGVILRHLGQIFRGAVGFR